MSFADFDRGITARQLQEQRDASEAADSETRAFANWRESEHVLNILRKIKPNTASGDEAMDQWLQSLNS